MSGLTQWEVDWAVDAMAQPPLDLTLEEVEDALLDSPDDLELQQLYTLVSLQTLSSL